jgi:acid phosphatase
MKKLYLLACLLAFAGGLAAVGARADAALPDAPAGVIAWPAGLPVYDHVVIVIEENKDYEQIIDEPGTSPSKAPYINQTLRKQGATLTRMFGEEHNSQGNYFWLFSGSNQHVGFRDGVPDKTFHAPNLGAALIAAGRAFKGFSEDLPAIGSTELFGPVGAAPADRLYARKHAPWVSFANVPNGATVATSSNLRFADFPTDPAGFAALPTVAIVVPNLLNDMHNGEPGISIPRGDAWLKTKLDAYYQWAKTHNSLLIVTWDENDDEAGDDPHAKVLGLTDPAVVPTDQRTRNQQNRIATVLAGARVRPGDYPQGKGVTHVNLLRTLESMYGLPRSGAQQPHAAASGIHDDYTITDIFEKAN